MQRKSCNSFLGFPLSLSDMLAQSAANSLFSTQICRIFWETQRLSDLLTVLFTVNRKWGKKHGGKNNKTSAAFSLFISKSAPPHRNFKFVSSCFKEGFNVTSEICVICVIMMFTARSYFSTLQHIIIFELFIYHEYYLRFCMLTCAQAVYFNVFCYFIVVFESW